MNTSTITRTIVADNRRINHTATLFGIHFPMRLEPAIFNIAGNLAAEYDGGLWDFFALSNGGFYMAPNTANQFNVSCENGYEGSMSADALGITACLYAYSHLSFGGPREFSEVCAEQYHWLREFALDHSEAGSIFRAID